MRKNNFKKNINTLKLGLKEIYKLQPWVLPVTILGSLFKAVAPFVNIYVL